MHCIPTHAKRGLPALGLVIVLAGCGGGAGADVAQEGGAEAPSADALTVVATEFAFDPGSFTVPADTSVEVVLDNQGVIEHDITIDDTDVRIYADASETASGQLMLAAGTYTFYCDIPGHRDSGMEGTVTAE